MDKPLVTIITPTYNAAHWLPETVRSILSQDYPHLEYLVYDDGSTDNTQAVLAEFLPDPRLRVYRHENIGEVKSINRGFREARGELLGNISADDPLLSRSAISLMVREAQRSPETLVFYPDFHLIDAHGDLIQRVITREWDYEYMVSHHHCTPGPGALMRRSLLETVGYRNPDPKLRWVADLEYWLRVGLVGKMQKVPYFLATHRRHPEQLTTKMRGKAMAQQHLYVYECFFQGLCVRPQDTKPKPDHVHQALWKLRGQAWAYTYLTCAYVSPGDYASMAKYLWLAVRSHPPIIKDIGPLLLSKGVQVFSHTKGC